jgi:hypothetical protein
MPSRRDVQEVLFGQWGINLVTGNGRDPDLVLTEFLENFICV